MRKRQLLIEFIIVLFFVGCRNIKTENKSETTDYANELVNNPIVSNSSDSTIIKMLTDFYTAHNEIMLSKLPDKDKTDSAVFDSLIVLYETEEDRQTDSLNSIYCTERLKKEAKDVLAFGGNDMLTGDRVGLYSNENLKVTKDSQYYVVQFLASSLNTWFTDGYSKKGELFQQQVILQITIVKEGEFYKIDSVDDKKSYWMKSK